ncbi:MAG: hypothetical protein QNI92_09790 [Desulfobacterales bacterium]|nr:hypothetical protein [Desulfobacterales bacterium]
MYAFTIKRRTVNPSWAQSDGCRLLLFLFIGFNRIWHFTYIRRDAMLWGFFLSEMDAGKIAFNAC